MAFDLQNRSVLVTGASSGIGEATARAMAAAGARVALVSERAEDLHAVAHSLKEQGGQAFPIVADFAKPEQVEDLVCRVEEQVGPLEILVNNAGIGMCASITEMRPEEVRLLFEINFFALASLCRQALREMGPRGKGHILNISSAAGQFGLANFSAYSATKGAVHAYTQSLRVEARPRGIFVSEVTPISVRTPFFDNVRGRTYRPVGVTQTVETVARSIVKCAAARRPSAEVLPYRPIQAVFVMSALFPALMSRLSGRNYARAARQQEKAAKRA